MSNEDAIRLAIHRTATVVALDGSTIKDLPRILTDMPDLTDDDMHILRSYVMQDLEERFPSVFDVDAMRMFYNEHTLSNEETDTAWKKVLKRLDLDPDSTD